MHYSEIEDLFSYRLSIDQSYYELMFANNVKGQTDTERKAELWVIASREAVNTVLNHPGLISGDVYDAQLKTYIEGHPDYKPLEHTVYQLALRLIRERDAIDNILKIRR
jgi:hypothetical protein